LNSTLQNEDDDNRRPARRDMDSTFQRMRDEMEKVYNTMMNSLLLRSESSGNILPKGAIGSLTLKPRVDIVEHKDHYRIAVEIPGVSEKDVKLNVSDHNLVIRGEKAIEKEDKDDKDGSNWHRLERAYGSFKRVLDLPDDADAEDINAEFKDGVLTIKISRKEEAEQEGRSVEIKKAA